jgi:hypothetical protein
MAFTAFAPPMPGLGPEYYPAVSGVFSGFFDAQYPPFYGNDASVPAPAAHAGETF